MAVEAVVISAVAAVAHDDVLMLGRNNDISGGVVADRGRLSLLVANIAIVIRSVSAGCREQLSGGNPGSSHAEEIGINERDFRQASRTAPEVKMECRGQADEYENQRQQDH